jgi:hypothetical protein
MPDLRLEYVEPSTLGPNPANWRTHSADQRATFGAILAEVGWSDPLLYNERTGRLLDGHMRREEAIAAGIPAVPVVVGSWDEATERKILATRDTLGMLAGVNSDAFRELLDGIDTGSPELMSLFSDLAESFGIIPADGEPGEPGAGDLDTEDLDAEDLGEPVADGPADVCWPSDDEWGIPRLDPRMQALAPIFPIQVWASTGRRRAMPGTWLFYAADRKFESIWKNPGAILLSGPACAVEPNYSTHPQMPRAFVLWGIYRKRWVARWWQSRGVRTFVDLNVGEEVAALNLLGVPREWRAYATRSHSGGSAIESEFSLAAAHAGTDDLCFLVYGGGAAVKKLCGSRGWHWCPEQSDTVRGKVP